MKEENDKLKNENKELKEENDKLKNENDKIKQDLEDINDENEKIKNEDNLIKEKNTKLNNDKENLENEIKTLKSKILDYEENINDINKEKEKINNEKEKINNEKENIINDKNKLEKEKNEIISEKEKIFNELNNNINELKKENEILKEEKNTLIKDKETIEKNLISNEEIEKIKNELGIKNNLPIVLIFGGSQGAQKINEAVEEIIKKEINETYQIIWATGPKQYDIIKEKISNKINNLKNTKIVPYIYNMEELMNISDLLVCRSGAMTITEISIVGKPAIFIPLPSHSANRQEDNAKVLEKLGAAKIILNEELTYNNLAKEIDEIINDKETLEKMGIKARTIAPSNVESKIYKEIKKVVR